MGISRSLLLLILASWSPTCLRLRAESIVERHWFELRTAHFLTYSCGSTQEVARLAARLEQFREAYSLLAGAQAVASPPIIVMAFPDQEAMKPFLPLYKGKPASVTAFFKPGSDENLIVLPLSMSVSLEAVFHEYTHLLFRHNDPFWPLWLKEGMAEIYGTFEAVGGTRIRIGKPVKRHLGLLAEEPLMPLSELFSVTEKSPEYNEEAHQGIFYAQSWLLTHYLMLGPRKTQFAQFTPLLRQGQTPFQAFTNAFHTSFAVIEKELNQYRQREKLESLDLGVNTDLLAPRAQATRRISPSETCFRLGDQLLRLDRLDTAQSYFERAQELAPRSPLAAEGLGLLAAEREQSEQAVKQLGEALQRGSKSFLAHYVYAREKYRLTSKSPERYSTLAAPAAAEIRGELQKALTLMPDFGPAHHLLGFFELVQGEDPAAAERHLQKAIQLEPELQGYLLTLAQAKQMREGPESARRVLEPLRRANVEPKLRAQAEEMLKELAR